MRSSAICKQTQVETAATPHSVFFLNPLPFSDAVRKQKKNLEDLSSSVLSQFKKYHPPGNQKFNYLGILKRLKFRISSEIILYISLKLNFTPNTLGCYRLNNAFSSTMKLGFWTLQQMKKSGCYQWKNTGEMGKCINKDFPSNNRSKRAQTPFPSVILSTLKWHSVFITYGN